MAPDRPEPRPDPRPEAPPVPSAPPPAPAADGTVELALRARAGDRAALEALLEQTYPLVLGLVRRRLGPGLRRFAESGDLVQEAMGEVARGLGGFEPRGEDALVRWMAGVVENRLRDLAKHHGRRKRDGARLEPLEPPPGASWTGYEPARSTLSPLERAERAEAAARVRAALATLPARQREAVERRTRGESWAAVAAAVGAPSEGAARMLFARAKVALAKAVGARAEEGSDGDA